MAVPTLAAGLQGRAQLTVADRDTATAFASGSVPVLATPRLVALMEEAAVDATRGRLAPGETTVGTRIDIAHLSPTPVGRQVRADATLDVVDGRSLRFSVVAWDGEVKIGEGTHLRVVIDERRFLERLRRGAD